MENSQQDDPFNLSFDSFDFSQLRSRQERLQTYRDNQERLIASQQRSWLRKHGKRDYIDFDDSTRNELRRYFLSMDSNGSGTIGLEELMEPLIALGLAENREQVQAMFTMVDTDNSGFIEFKEFLDILKNRESESKIFEFFKSLTKGKLIKDANLLPFTLVVNNYRRKMLIDAVTSDVPERKTKGEKVMKAYISSLKSDK